MLLAEPTNFVERRSKPIFAAEFVSPAAIARIESIVARDVESHDATFELGKNGLWIPNYSLASHHVRTGMVMSAVGAARLRNISEIGKGRCAAVVHDIGKIDESCLPYRLDRVLTDEERSAVSRHPDLSAEYVLKHKNRIRVEDHPFLDDVATLVRHHHSPWLVGDETLREICFDLHLADIYVSLMEDRHRPGRSQFEALDKLEQIIALKRSNNSLFAMNDELVRLSFETLRRLYGRPNF